MPTAHPKKLLVEGKEDQYAVAELMAHHITWGNSSDEWPVYIEPLDGVENLLRKDMISTYLKESQLEALGILLDANDKFDGRWQRIRDECKLAFPTIPDVLPAEGLVVNKSRQRLGVWFMPDNRSSGMLESFLTYLVPAESADLWKYAQKAVGTAITKGAPLKTNHRDKARIHTWLAWQDPPGLPLGLALKQKCLDPNSNHAQPFIRWFKKLYEL